jgi:hypothetical protein
VNGWACCVSGEDRDSDYLDALLMDADLDHEFKELLTGDFLVAARDFESTWPIFSSKDIGYNVQWDGTREQVIERYRTIIPLPGCKRHAPSCTAIAVKRCLSTGLILFRRCTRCAAICFTAIKACIRRTMFGLYLRRSGF